MIHDDETFDPWEPLTEIELATLHAGEVARTPQDDYALPTAIQRLIREVRQLRAAKRAAEIPDRLCRSEINGQVAWFFDSGHEWHLGDEREVWKVGGEAPTFTASVSAMAKAAAELYPDSEFTKWFNGPGR